ncbi:histidine phosphatase family protein [Alcaligenaceae bacterium LF4-65]|uniref:Histidine phosphatase family protein n=1 Tax=Zwartia hollandica TaxID=324606 RepID=A0A953N6U2_9BURK|nr:histidine phosphatase family protein [Zwartia hollandica]MBZ1349108.1 histidine phosphatase family protein [Zwartia hollandica]
MKKLLVILLLLSANVGWAQDQVLIDRLRQGGLNIFIRHAITPGSDSSKFNPPSERPNDCSSGSRQLNEEGREQSRRIGKRIKELDIPIGEVYSSSFCRCEETAKLAFDRFTTVEWLLIKPGTFQSQLDRELRSVPSAGFFSKTPTGKNNVFVGHAVTFLPGTLSNELSLVRLLAEGEALIIEPGSPPKKLGRIKFF